MILRIHGAYARGMIYVGDGGCFWVRGSFDTK